MRTVPSRPYPWPYHGAFRPEQTALLLFSGDAPVEVPSDVQRRLIDLITSVRRAGITVVALPFAGTADPRFEGAADLVVSRPHYGAFYGTDIDRILRRRGLRDLLIAGAPFELGADCTMREANDLGYECLVVEDCCAPLSAETFAGAINTLQYSGGIFGVSATAAAVTSVLDISVGV